MKAESFTDNTVVNLNGIKTILAKMKQDFSNSPKNFPRNPPDCTIS